MSRTGRPWAIALTAALAVAALPAEPASAASWQAVDTVAASGLGGTAETFDASTVDYDRDGDQDVWIGHHDEGGRLYRNDGSGVYTRVAAAAWPKFDAVSGKVPDRHQCVWADVDLDGRPDSYCAAGRGTVNAVKTGKDNELWLQRSPGVFTEVGTAWGVGDPCGRSHYPAFLHANGDRYPDLFVGNVAPRDVTGDPCDDPANGLGDERNKLFLNVGGTGFRLASPASGIGGNGGGRCAEVVDYDSDGWQDLLTCGPGLKLWHNDAGSGFTDVTAAQGLTTGASDAVFGDLDRDGDPDLVTSQFGQFGYRLNTAGRFGPEVRIAGIPGGGGRSVAVGDADGDGDLDVYGLVSLIAARTNPDDVVYRNAGLRFTAVPVPTAAGVGDAVATLRGDHGPRAEFLALNGVESPGPVQRVELVFR